MPTIMRSASKVGTNDVRPGMIGGGWGVEGLADSSGVELRIRHRSGNKPTHSVIKIDADGRLKTRYGITRGQVGNIVTRRSWTQTRLSKEVSV